MLENLCIINNRKNCKILYYLGFNYKHWTKINFTNCLSTIVVFFHVSLQQVIVYDCIKYDQNQNHLGENRGVSS